MPFALLLVIAFLVSFVPAMAGLGGGLIFLPLIVLLKFPVTTAVSASFFKQIMAEKLKGRTVRASRFCNCIINFCC